MRADVLGAEWAPAVREPSGVRDTPYVGLALPKLGRQGARLDDEAAEGALGAPGGFGYGNRREIRLREGAHAVVILCSSLVHAPQAEGVSGSRGEWACVSRFSCAVCAARAPGTVGRLAAVITASGDDLDHAS